MNIGVRDVVPARGLRGRRGLGRFLWHYAEMLLAMLVGMATLYVAWSVLTGAAEASWLRRTEVDVLAMATSMAVPMAAWMRLRRHDAAAIWEMTLAMYAAFLVFLPFLWIELIDEDALLLMGHVVMLVLMAAVMLRRPHEHAGAL